MTEHTPDITTGFIQMVEAFKAKPELEARISNLEHDLDAKAENESRMAQRIAQLEASLASASSDKERLTRERDEAMFRSLELEEKTSAVSNLVAKLEGLVRPEPVAKVEAPVQVSETAKDVDRTDYSNRIWDEEAGHYRDVEPQSNVETFRPEYSGQGSHEPNAEQRSSVESQYPNWDSPTKSEQNTEGSHSGAMAGTNVVKDHDYYVARERNTPEGYIYDRYADEYRQHDNFGKPYHDKPWWVNDNDWKSQGGQGPHEGGSWQAPWERPGAFA